MEKLFNPTQEDWFDMWTEELLDAGYIDEVVSHPNVPTFQLFNGLSKPYDKKKNVILNPVAYTPLPHHHNFTQKLSTKVIHKSFLTLNKK